MRQGKLEICFISNDTGTGKSALIHPFAETDVRLKISLIK
jgi:hypothetical protein